MAKKPPEPSRTGPRMSFVVVPSAATDEPKIRPWLDSTLEIAASTCQRNPQLDLAAAARSKAWSATSGNPRPPNVGAAALFESTGARSVVDVDTACCPATSAWFGVTRSAVAVWRSAGESLVAEAPLIPVTLVVVVSNASSAANRRSPSVSRLLESSAARAAMSRPTPRSTSTFAAAKRALILDVADDSSSNAAVLSRMSSARSVAISRSVERVTSAISANERSR